MNLIEIFNRGLYQTEESVNWKTDNMKISRWRCKKQQEWKGMNKPVGLMENNLCIVVFPEVEVRGEEAKSLFYLKKE